MSEIGGKQAARLRHPPVATPVPFVSEPASNTVSQIRVREADPEPPPSRQPRILVVDDVEGNRDVLSRRLRRKGYQTQDAIDGHHAMELLSSESFDLVMLDIMMPGIDGIGVLRWIRARWTSFQLPVIMQSAKNERESIVLAFEMGANDYVTKPIDFSVAEARIRTHIELKQAHQDLQRRNEFIRNVFGRYVACDVVDRLLEQPDGLELGGKLRDVTILFCDIRGFSCLCESLSPEQVVCLINTYLGAATRVVEDHGGCVNEFVGDAVLAIFNAPVKTQNHETRAVACALAMQLEIEHVNERLAAMSLPPIEIGVGVHTGECVVGNTGSERRAKFGVVGAPVNIAARIESLTVGGQVLVSDVTVARMQAPVEVTQRYEVSVKGADRALQLLDVVGLTSDRALLLPSMRDALMPLPSSVPCHLSVLTGKRISDQVHHASIEASSTRRVLIRVKGYELQTLDDVRIRIPTVAAGAGLYAKVVGVEGPCHVLRFTSVPGAAAAWLESLASLVASSTGGAGRTA